MSITINIHQCLLARPSTYIKLSHICQCLQFFPSTYATQDGVSEWQIERLPLWKTRTAIKVKVLFAFMWKTQLEIYSLISTRVFHAAATATTATASPHHISFHSCFENGDENVFYLENFPIFIVANSRFNCHVCVCVCNLMFSHSLNEHKQRTAARKDSYQISLRFRNPIWMIMLIV